MKHLLIRALGIWTIKTVVYAAFTIVSILFLLESVSHVILSAAHYFMTFLLVFLFSEWIFMKARVNLRRLVVVIVSTFAWDIALSLAFSVWLLGPYRYATPWYQNVLFFAIHASAMSLAYYARKRFAAMTGLPEGLEA